MTNWVLMPTSARLSNQDLGVNTISNPLNLFSPKPLHAPSFHVANPPHGLPGPWRRPPAPSRLRRRPPSPSRLLCALRACSRPLGSWRSGGPRQLRQGLRLPPRHRRRSRPDPGCSMPPRRITFQQGGNTIFYVLRSKGVGCKEANVLWMFHFLCLSKDLFSFVQ